MSSDAVKDLRAIAKYTLETWGEEIFEKYRSGLKTTFEKIANIEVLEKNFSKTFPDL
ncbi:MAG: type II toxin-antitoxin system RelE/ParE family toxin [Alcanivoracaceae bacterium]|nr:type II toxin-antitoxin system RelE/ParE family toxin [Alcanivoracaceae bacterium]